MTIFWFFILISVIERSYNLSELMNDRYMNDRITYIHITYRSSQPAFPFSKLTIETLEQGVKYVQS